MDYDHRKIAGLLLFLATAQFFVGLMIAAARYPGYSIADNFISDLGVGPAAFIFNSSVILAGVLVLGATFSLYQVFTSRVLTAVAIVAGAGFIGVGVFTEDFPLLHSLFSLVAFISLGLFALVAAVFVRSPLRYLSIILGAVSLAALGLFIARIDLGLGIGGMERMIVLPILAWAIAFGGYLMAGESA